MHGVVKHRGISHERARHISKMLLTRTHHFNLFVL